ncbi:hypothetical protein [Prauserella rugosa]|uniref:hypothetical protein n=1 Tax=Prauserella rugosa TaxID=43354 RepID=UPI00319E31AD
MQTITGSAAGVPYTALPPRGVDGRAALIITWHMLDAPRTDAAFAAALPMADVPAWRVHLAMPMCGGRMVDGSVDAVVELARRDAVRAFLVPFVREAAAEFPAVLDALRSQLPIVDGPVGVLGGSLGGAVVLEVLAGGDVPIGTAALVNPAVRARWCRTSRRCRARRTSGRPRRTGSSTTTTTSPVSTVSNVLRCWW